MVSEPKKKVTALGNIQPMGDDPKAFPEADYLANAERAPRSLRTWSLAIAAIVVLTLLGILAIYGFAKRIDYQGHH